MNNILFISKLKPRTITLGKRARSISLAPTPNLMRGIVNFARHMSLRSIPAKTVEKLKSDPYFRYCFSILSTPDFIFEKDGSPRYPETVKRLARLLQDPNLATDKDLSKGIANFLNNFYGYLPGGFYRLFYENYLDDSDMSRQKRIITLVDNYLNERALMKEAVALQKKHDHGHRFRSFSSPIYKDSVKYLKFCLKVFDHLVVEHGYEAKELMI